jgi:hypothetical protein
MAGASEGAEGAAFARTLSALKERGSNLLVVGTVYDRGHVAVCERLLGEAAADRRRLLVRTDGSCGTVPSVGDGDVRVVEQRSPAVDGPDSAGVAVDSVVEGGIGALERAAVDGFDGLAAAGGDPEPAEMRLCVDSLRPLLVDHAEGEVRRFVDRLSTRVAEDDGMGHFHLPAGSDDRYVSMLTPVVDAVVEVRVRGGEPQQRWHVFEGAVDSGWLAL